MKLHVRFTDLKSWKQMKIAFPAIMLILISLTFSMTSFSQGTWTPVTSLSPGSNGGGALLLSDGSVICKSFSGGTDGIGNVYDKLTPDSHGSYINGTWTSIAPMNKTRLYYSSQVLKDGRVYVAGGEYGSGGSFGETYDPLTNAWTMNGAVGGTVSDANSEILEDGTVMQALVTSNLKVTKTWNPMTSVYSAGPSCIGIHNESAWVKLADGSILFIDRNTTNSERYIPSLAMWVADATVPVSVYDPYGLESGGAVLLPDGRAFFIGSTGHNAIYTPSGTNAPGTWAAAADFPNAQGTPDAGAAMMVNGKVLCATSPVPTSGNHFPTPTSFYEYDYTSNSFTRINSPAGGLTLNVSCYLTGMICLPNGQILYSTQNSNQYYIYTPDGSPLASGKPTINKIRRIYGGVFKMTGTGFNGISEGASYGDDWQMNTNYPIVRLTSGSNVYYARTYNWNSTGVMRGSKADTVSLKIPLPLPAGNYSLVVTANGIASDPIYAHYNGLNFTATDFQGKAIFEDAATDALNVISVYPNPAINQTTIKYTIAKASNVSIQLLNQNGNTMKVLLNKNLEQGNYTLPLSTSGLVAGTYSIQMLTDKGVQTIKLIVQ
ncbi:MAG: T9SS type A sorting domain-containing protein [Chitinophagaceae bacterium]